MATDRRPWVKLDVGYLDNPKISELLDDNPRAILLHLFCITYSKQHGTDGRVPMRLAMRRACAEQCDLELCIDLGILRIDGDLHVVVHDYVAHQGTAVENAEAAKTASQRAKHAAETRWERARNHAPEHAPSNAPSMPDRCDIDAEKRREEKSKELCAPDDAQPDRFDDFWQAYPKKVSKKRAQERWKAATKKADPQVILDGLARYVAFLNQPGQWQKPKDPDGWLSQERWNDQLDSTHADSEARKPMPGEMGYVTPEMPAHIRAQFDNPQRGAR